MTGEIVERTVGIASLAAPTKPAPSLLALRVAIGGTAILAAVAGYAAGHAMDVSTTFRPEASLVMLLRFMAVMKLAVALGAVALTSWRIAAPIRLPLALAYAVASALMLAAPGLIWAMATVAIGAVIFHAGLFIFVVAAWADRDTVVGRRGLKIRVPTRRTASISAKGLAVVRCRNALCADEDLMPLRRQGRSRSSGTIP